MPVNSTHPDYDANLAAWQRARDAFAGEDAVKAAGEKYLPRLDSQSEADYLGYKARASFFNATARTADGLVGLLFRRAPLIRLPEHGTGGPTHHLNALGRALHRFVNDADLLGTRLAAYAKNVVQEIILVGRAGSLVDWEGAGEQRAYAAFYPAEQIINWHSERVNGRQVLTLVVLKETSPQPQTDADEFQPATVGQLRILKLVPAGAPAVDGQQRWTYQVEIWRPAASKTGPAKTNWALVEQRTPLRQGQPLPLIPFVFHGLRHSQPAVDKLLLADIIAVNFDHYRLNADFKHGLHFTALPTAWVSGFEKTDSLRIGSSRCNPPVSTRAPRRFSNSRAEVAAPPRRRQSH